MQHVPYNYLWNLKCMNIGIFVEKPNTVTDIMLLREKHLSYLKHVPLHFMKFTNYTLRNTSGYFHNVTDKTNTLAVLQRNRHTVLVFFWTFLFAVFSISCSRQKSSKKIKTTSSCITCLALLQSLNKSPPHATVSSLCSVQHQAWWETSASSDAHPVSHCTEPNCTFLIIKANINQSFVKVILMCSITTCSSNSCRTKISKTSAV